MSTKATVLLFGVGWERRVRSWRRWSCHAYYETADESRGWPPVPNYPVWVTIEMAGRDVICYRAGLFERPILWLSGMLFRLGFRGGR